MFHDIKVVHVLYWVYLFSLPTLLQSSSLKTHVSEEITIYTQNPFSLTNPTLRADEATVQSAYQALKKSVEIRAQGSKRIPIHYLDQLGAAEIELLYRLGQLGKEAYSYALKIL